ncbi:MAG: ribosome maturation factor RimM [Chromatiales bacterium]|nr:ribosome maturation factor RimM [Chromatiales bacterium]
MADQRGKQADRPASGSQWVTLGRISGLFGVRGWVKVYSDTAPRKNILDYPVWYLRQKGDPKAYKLRTGKVHGKGLVALLEGVEDRDQAAQLLQADIVVPREQLPKADADEFYWADLEGLAVKTVEGVDLGRVDHLFETGANDVMVVKGDKQRLIPFIQDVVITVDLAEKLIAVDWDPDF